ncbi:MAG: hypothetical protein PHQ99_00215 [Atribacterota bacterium]|jgi:hypothetical protein|nr:hypothetical protein [Atribacterota bacterium]MDD3640530.1 hypothetical protein [Atribacterota bacterium]MDD4288009.1 hypothetical protein [Atribacterota bacterium]MDI9596387.1 hypothetical protein [Atribacterota bacterium]
MFRNIVIVISILMVAFLLAGINAAAQRNITDILYGDLAQIETFGYIYVKVQGERAPRIGLSSEELTDYAKLRYKNNFSGIEYQEITAEETSIFQEEEKAKRAGSIWFRVWIAGENSPIAYLIECKAGNYEKYEMWTDEVLGICDEKDIKQIARNHINRMIEDFAIIFFKVRGEI